MKHVIFHYVIEFLETRGRFSKLYLSKNMVIHLCFNKVYGEKIHIWFQNINFLAINCVVVLHGRWIQIIECKKQRREAKTLRSLRFQSGWMFKFFNFDILFSIKTDTQYGLAIVVCIYIGKVTCYLSTQISWERSWKLVNLAT